VSANDGGQPKWRGDGRELFYLGSDGAMMAVDIRAGAAIDAGGPRSLFRTNLPVNFMVDQYAVTPDGQRFLLMNPVRESQAISTITVWLDWPALLKPH
jgi:hypothetical protein